VVTECSVDHCSRLCLKARPLTRCPRRMSGASGHKLALAILASSGRDLLLWNKPTNTDPASVLGSATMMHMEEHDRPVSHERGS